MNRHTLTYILGLLLFGLNGIVASRINLTSCSIVFFRTMTGSLFLTLLFYLNRGRFEFNDMNRTHLKYVLISGMAMGISWMFLYEAYQRTGVGLSSLLYYTGPVIVVLLSPAVFKEKITPWKCLCFILVLAGMLAVNAQNLSGGGDLYGIVLALGSAVMYAFMVIFNKKALSITGMKNSIIQLSTSFLTVAVFVLLFKGADVPAGPSQWGWMLLLGILNTGIGCYLYFSSIGHIPVQQVSVLGYLEPLSALIFSVVLLKEAFTPVQYAGAVLILLGAVMINRKENEESNIIKNPSL